MFYYHFILRKPFDVLSEARIFERGILVKYHHIKIKGSIERRTTFYIQNNVCELYRKCNNKISLHTTENTIIKKKNLQLDDRHTVYVRSLCKNTCAKKQQLEAERTDKKYRYQ